MHHRPDAGRRSGGGDIGGAVGLHILKGLAALEKNAAEIDHRLGAGDGRRHALRIGDIAFHEIDLADGSQRAQEKAPAGRRAATLIRQPARASARTVCRPRKPVPPKTVTVLESMTRALEKPHPVYRAARRRHTVLIAAREEREEGSFTAKKGAIDLAGGGP